LLCIVHTHPVTSVLFLDSALHCLQDLSSFSFLWSSPQSASSLAMHSLLNLQKWGEFFLENEII